MTTTTSSSSSSSSSSAAARHQNNANNAFYTLGEFDHPYPTTKLMFSPQGSIAPGKELLATTGDYLRIWSVNEDIGGSGSVDDQGNPRASCTLSSLLNNNKNSEYCAPLTSFDWNSTDPGIVGTSSIDTTCTIWDIETGVARTQLIAHDKEVYDIAFARGTDVFASVGADGSVRMFDLRSLEHSTIIYESSNQDKKDPKFTPLLRLAWNKQDPNYLATVLSSSSSTVILDIRVPSLPVAVLSGHNASVNSIAWAPHSSCHICSAADDHFALIWDLSSMPKPIEDPILAYDAKVSCWSLVWFGLGGCFGEFVWFFGGEEGAMVFVYYHPRG